ncbi:unnamed protein product [Alopecurus aequalis]
MAASLSKTLGRRLRGSGHRLLPSRPCTSHASQPPPPPAAAAPPSPGAGKEASAWSKLFLFAPGAISFGLGTWQLFRRQEKIEMLDYRTRRLEMEPVAWNETVSSAALRDPAELEFRKIVCEGDFDEEKSVFIGPRSRSISGLPENGYYVITPLKPRLTEPGSLQLPILVNRGWVPHGWRDKKIQDDQDLGETLDVKEADKKTDKEGTWWKFWSKKPEPESSSEIEKPVKPPVRVIGVIRGSENPSIFVPANEPSNGQWFYVDVPMIARACGLPENTVYIEDMNEDISATNPYPLPKDVNALIHHSVMPDDHLRYTATWYTLSAAVTYMATKRIKPKKIRL